MTAKRLRLNLVHRVTDVPEPQIRLRQSRVHRLGGSYRHETFRVGAAEKNGNPHQVRSIPIRLISQCSSIPAFSFTLARTVSPRVSISWTVAPPGLIRKWQRISET